MKRAFSLFLAVVMLFTSLPLTALAATDSAQSTQNGAQEVTITDMVEANSDHLIIEAVYDENDNTVTVEHYPNGANLYVVGYIGGQLSFTATKHTDGVFDLPEREFDQLKVFALDKTAAPMCEAKVIAMENHVVSFYDGERLIEEIVTPHGDPLIRVPDINKISKKDAIFVGYYTDPACTQLFYADNPVTSAMTVYAGYEELEKLNTEPQESYFTLLDQQPDLSFTLQRMDGAVDPMKAATLKVMDGSDPVELQIADNGDGTYTVSAPAGFNAGSTYELELADGWVFAGKSEAIRTASFTIFMEEQMNLEMSDEIVYIADTAALKYTMDGRSYDVLTSSNLSENGGTFAYGTAYAEGTTLCIYEGKHPEQRDPKVSSDLLSPVVYVKVISSANGVVTFRPVETSEQADLYNIPDNFPIQVADLTTAAADLDNLDLAVYQQTSGEDLTLADAKASAAKGDFVTLYVGKLTDSTEVRYGRITGYNAQTGEITYEAATKDDIIHSMDTYMTLKLEGEDLLSDEDVARLEAELTTEIDESDFGEELAYAMADVVTKSGGLLEEVSAEDLMLTETEGMLLHEGETTQMNGEKVKLDKLKIRPQIIRKGESLHFHDSGIGSVQLALQVEMQLSVETDGGTLITELKATFVEEVGVDPKLKAWHGFGEVYNQVPNAIGLRVSGHVDVLNYTALSFDAKIYTAENNEKKEKFETLQQISKSPLKELGIETMNSDLLKNLKDLGEMMDKYEYLTKYLNTLTVEQDEMKEEVKEALKEIEQYAKGEEVLQFKELAAELKRQVVTSDMMNMIYLGDKGLEAEYYDTLDALMGRYKEMVKQESEWMDLVEKEIFSAEVCYYGIALGIDVSFVVSIDVSLAIGSNLEYEVGKRFTVWYLLTGDLHSDHGCTSTNIIDEKFSFQFYIMGRLGLRAGLRARVFIGLFSGKFASIGLAVELGPYLKLYGLFVYHYNRILEVGSSKPKVESEAHGALYIEIGVYFKLDVDASAIGGLLSWDTTILEKELPVVKIGDQYFVYAFAANLDGEAESFRVIDNDLTTPDVITMKLPASQVAVKRMDMKSGEVATYVPWHEDIYYSLSNSAFTYNPKTQVVTVQLHNGVRYVAGDLTMTYRLGKAAFSSKDLAVTVPLVWTNLKEEDIVKDVKLSILVGNDTFGWHNITWDELYVNGELTDLPDATELVNHLVEKGYDPDAKYKYASGNAATQCYTYTNTVNADGRNEVVDRHYIYVCELQNRRYSIAVEGVANETKGTYTDVYYTKAIFGDAFDFSFLSWTGMNDHENRDYTKFSTVRAYASDEQTGGHGSRFPYDPLQPLNADMCALLERGSYAVAAVYEDNSATATFQFSGMTHGDVTQKLLKGTMPDFSEIGLIASAAGMDIAAITPAIGKISKNTTYTVHCKTMSDHKATVTFHDGMGGTVALTAGVGSVLALPGLIREGYDFGGWYTDEALTKVFPGTKVPSSDLNLYAKWTGQTRRIFVELKSTDPVLVTYGQPIGDQLPALGTDPKMVFGWMSDDRIINERTVVDWKDYIVVHKMEAYINTIDLAWNDLFRFYQTGSNQNHTAPAYIYDGKDHSKNVFVYEGPPPYGEEYDIQESDFIIRFRKHGTEEFVPVVDVGNYDAVITRAEDEYRGTGRKHYRKWEAVVENAVSVKTYDPEEEDNRAELLEYVEAGLTSVKAKIKDDFVKAAGPDASYTFTCTQNGTTIEKKITGKTSVEFTGLSPATSYTIKVTVVPNNPNFADPAATIVRTSEVRTGGPSGDWKNFADGTFVNKYLNDPELALKKETVKIDTAEELAAIMYVMNQSSGSSFSNKTFKLTADIDLSDHYWNPNSVKVFEGVFDGNGHTISGLFVAKLNGNQISGLFGKVGRAYSGKKTVIKNLTMKDCYVTFKGGYLGGLVSEVVGNVDITNCKFEGFTVVGYDDGTTPPTMGALIGRVTSGDQHNVNIADCTIHFDLWCYSQNADSVIGVIVGKLMNEKPSVLFTNTTIDGLVHVYKSVTTGVGICGSYPDKSQVKADSATAGAAKVRLKYLS